MINVLLVEDRKMSRDSMIGYMKGSDQPRPPMRAWRSFCVCKTALISF